MYVLGIDVGGTKSVCLLAAAGAVRIALAEACGGAILPKYLSS